MNEIQWKLYPLVAKNQHAKSWLDIQANLGRAKNTIDAYGRGLNDYLLFAEKFGVNPENASREQISLYVRDLFSRSSYQGIKIKRLDSGSGLASATIQQRLTVIRLYYDFLLEETIIKINPVGRGRFTPRTSFATKQERGLIPRIKKQPWIPNEEQWKMLINAVCEEPLRNRVIFALAYDCALRREEVVTIEVEDIDFVHRLLTIRAEKTKNRQDRIIPFSKDTNLLIAFYKEQRKLMNNKSKQLFISESPRNYAEPIGLWSWNRICERLARRSGVNRFTSHTLRHLCLTDLARAGWEIWEIAKFAGHRSLESTNLYIHLSGRELAMKFERGLAKIHQQRINQMKEVFVCEQ